MKQVMQHLTWLFFFLMLSGCEQLDRQAEAVRGFFRQPTVQPVLEVIQTSVPAGFCAVVAMSDQLGQLIPGADVSHLDDLSLIRIKNHHAYPLSLLAVPCDEIYILRLGMGEYMSIISAFFVSDLSRPDRQRVYHIGPLPVMYDDQLVRAILARNYVSFEDELNLELNLNQGDIAMAIERLWAPKPEEVSVAVAQDAWIIEITPHDTWTDYSDDTFMITGGEQDISTVSDRGKDAASVLQMAMIGLLIDPGCLKNPVSGFSVLREIKVESSSQLDDLILGTLLYTFDGSCTGRVRIPLATGSFMLSLGQELEFNMTNNQYGFQ